MNKPSFPFSISYSLLFLTALWAALFLARLTAPSDLMDNDQEKPAAYVMDALRFNHWASQRDSTGTVMSKPPLYTWLAAGFTWLGGGKPRLLALYLPCALAVLVTTLLIFRMGREVFGLQAGFWGAWGYLLAVTTYKQLALIRTDPLFTALTFAAAWLVWRSWRSGKGWLLFWLAAAAITLTKGPLGILFALGGLWAALWPANPSLAEVPRKKPWKNWQHLFGLLLFLVISGGWFYLAWLQDGEDLINRMIKRELVGHALDSHDETPWWSFVTPFLYFVSRFAPWSFAALFAFGRILRKPDADGEKKLFERYWMAFFCFGMLLLTVASHKRADLNFPLLPAAALLGGRQIAIWLDQVKWRPALRHVLMLSLIAVLAFGLYSHLLRGRDVRVWETGVVKKAASQLNEKGVLPERILHLDTPYAFQFFLGGHQYRASTTEAEAALKQQEPAYVAVHKNERFADRLGSLHEKITLLRRWPEEGKGVLWIYSNQSSWEGALKNDGSQR